MRIMIIEDDLIIAENLKENLIELGYEVVGIATRFLEAKDLFESSTPDLCLVDIHLKGSEKNGIETVEELQVGDKIPIVYLTSFTDPEFLERAKNTNPSAYLIKPASKKQIDVTIDVAMSNFNKTIAQKAKEENGSLITFGEGYFFAKTNSRYEKVSENDLCYIEASGTYSTIFTDNKKIVISLNLKSFLKQIKSDSIIRCHRSYAVNKNKIVAFDDHSVFIKIKNEVLNLPISRSFRGDLFSSLPRLKSD